MKLEIDFNDWVKLNAEYGYRMGDLYNEFINQVQLINDTRKVRIISKNIKFMGILKKLEIKFEVLEE